jgi:hypothetical protein
MTSRFSLCAAGIVALGTLAACSNGDFIYGKALGDLASFTGITTGLEEVDPNTAEIAVTPADAEPPLVVGFEAIRVAIPFAGASGPSKTYVSPDNVVIAMNGPFVTRATGIGADLNGGYLPAGSPWFGNLAAAADEGASSDRVLEYWELGRLTRAKFRCDLSTAPRADGGQVIEEYCKRYFEPEEFTNRYWTRADGSVECSLQQFHPQLSQLQFFATEQQALTLNLTEQGC